MSLEENLRLSDEEERQAEAQSEEAHKVVHPVRCHENALYHRPLLTFLAVLSARVPTETHVLLPTTQRIQETTYSNESPSDVLSVRPFH